MAEGRLRVVAAPPGGAGLAAGLKSCVREGSVVTALSDTRLRLASRLLCDIEGTVEFVPLGDLIGRVLRMAGAQTQKLATRSQWEAIVTLACESLDGDTPLERCSTLPGMPRLLAERLGDLADHGIDSSRLRQVARTSPVPLQSKLETLATLADLAQDSAEPAHRERVTDRVMACLDERLDDCGPLKHVVVVMGSDRKPVVDDWLEWLSHQGVEVHLVFDVLPGRTDLFLDSQRTMARFKVKKPIVIGEAAWYEALFSTNVAEGGPKVFVTTMGDVLSECEWIVRDILRQVSDGVPQERIGVFVRDREGTAPLLAAMAQQHRLPLSMTRTVSLLSCGLANAVARVLESLVSSDVRRLAVLASSPYFQAGHQVAVEVLDAVRQASRHGTGAWGWLQEWNEKRAEPLPWLGPLLDWRREALGATHSLSRWLESFRKLIGSLSLGDVSSGDPSVDERDLRAQTVLQRVLADHAFIYDQAGRPPLGLVDFVRLARRLWEEETVTFGGDGPGVVVAHEADAIDDVDVLFVLGMLEGSIPKRRREDAILRDDERAAINAQLGTTLSDSRLDSKRERDDFVRICASARRELRFSYALTADDRDNVPASYLEEVRRALGGRVVDTDHGRQELLCPDGQDDSAADQRLREALSLDRRLPAQPKVRTDDIRLLLAQEWDEGTSVTHLAEALTCPFKAAFQRRLRVKLPMTATSLAPLLDLPRTSALATAPDPRSARSSLMSQLDQLVEDHAPNLEQWETEMLRATGHRLIEEWVAREFRSREIWPRSGPFVPDPSIDAHGLRNDPVVEGKRIVLTERLAAVGEALGHTWIQEYRMGRPRIDDFESQIESDEDAFRWALLLMVASNRGPQPLAIEIDGAFGGRVLARVGPEEGGPRRDVAAGLSTVHLSTHRERVLRAARNRLKQAVAVIDRADALATPGEHCSKCRLGELCRVSTQFGERANDGGDD